MMLLGQKYEQMLAKLGLQKPKDYALISRKKNVQENVYMEIYVAQNQELIMIIVSAFLMVQYTEVGQ